MAEDLSREAIERRRAAEKTAAAAETVTTLAERPELVLYANGVVPAVQGDGSVVLQLVYSGGPVPVRVADVVMPAAAFIKGIVQPAHGIVKQASHELGQMAESIGAAVARRDDMMGGTAGKVTAEDVARMRREAAGD
jgi:hypothetical protein